MTMARSKASAPPSQAMARSTDGGKTFANYAWTSDGFDGGDQFIGDYTGLAAYGGKVVGAWSETRGAKDPKKHSTLVRVGVAEFSK